MEPFVGQIQVFAFNYAPRGWASCEGQLLPINSYTALFSLIGTTYGGNGTTTFALPDLRARVVVGVGRGPGLSAITWGERFGNESTSITKNNLPPVDIKASSANASQSAPTAGSVPATPGTLSGRTFAATEGYTGGAPDVTLYNAGGNGFPINNRQPSLGMYYCIALQGIFPSRS
jgi:microcystin-dependent protein